MNSLQSRRAGQTQAVGAVTLEPFPNVEKLCPKLSKAFPDDVRALQRALDVWWKKAEGSLNKQFDRNGG